MNNPQSATVHDSSSDFLVAVEADDEVWLKKLKASTETARPATAGTPRPH